MAPNLTRAAQRPRLPHRMGHHMGPAGPTTGVGPAGRGKGSAEASAEEIRKSQRDRRDQPSSLTIASVVSVSPRRGKILSTLLRWASAFMSVTASVAIVTW